MIIKINLILLTSKNSTNTRFPSNIVEISYIIYVVYFFSKIIIQNLLVMIRVTLSF